MRRNSVPGESGAAEFETGSAEAQVPVVVVDHVNHSSPTQTAPLTDFVRCARMNGPLQCRAGNELFIC